MINKEILLIRSEIFLFLYLFLIKFYQDQDQEKKFYDRKDVFISLVFFTSYFFGFFFFFFLKNLIVEFLNIFFSFFFSIIILSIIKKIKENQIESFFDSIFIFFEKFFNFFRIDSIYNKMGLSNSDWNFKKIIFIILIILFLIITILAYIFISNKLLKYIFSIIFAVLSLSLLTIGLFLLIKKIKNSPNFGSSFTNLFKRKPKNFPQKTEGNKIKDM